MSIGALVAGVTVGFLSGATAGLMGISPGGGLVIFSTLLLGCEQHVAQGISLIAQVPPTSISGVKRYWDRGNRSPLRWLILLTTGFLIGGVGGAVTAIKASTEFLQWTYVFYLTALDALLIFRPRRQPPEESPGQEPQQLPWAGLIMVGLVAGFWLGFLGIGGGLAITVGLAAGLKVPQHQAQMISLVLSTIPTTAPAAWIYWRHSWSMPWPIMICVILGLLGVTDLGARWANRVSANALRRSVVGFVAAMAIYMAYKAVSH